LYTIQGKSVTVAAEGDNNDQLKVRVGSSWFSFDDYMTSVKSKMDRDEDEVDDEAATDSLVNAALEVPDDQESSRSSGGKQKKKKKKKAKKNARAELDLDMDVDDAMG